MNNKISKPSVSGEEHQRTVSEKDAEIQRLKEELALLEKWKNDTLNDLVTYKAHKDKEIRQLKAATPKELYKRNQRQEKMIETLQAEIQHLKSSRVKDIEGGINFMADLLPQIALNQLEPKQIKEFWEDWNEAKSEHLKPFQEVNNQK